MLAAGVFGILYPEHAHYIILLISLLLIVFGSKALLPYYESKKWIKSTATIRSIKETYELVKESEYSQVKYYYPLVEYFYKYNDATYTNTCVTFEKQNIWTSGINIWGDKLPESHKLWHSWGANNTVAVYIDPKSPQKQRGHRNKGVRSLIYDNQTIYALLLNTNQRPNLTVPWVN